MAFIALSRFLEPFNTNYLRSRVANRVVIKYSACINSVSGMENVFGSDKLHTLKTTQKADFDFHQLRMRVWTRSIYPKKCTPSVFPSWKKFHRTIYYAESSRNAVYNIPTVLYIIHSTQWHILFITRVTRAIKSKRRRFRVILFLFLYTLKV